MGRVGRLMDFPIASLDRLKERGCWQNFCVQVLSERPRSSRSPQSFVIVRVAFPYIRSDYLTIFWNDWGDWDDPDDHMETSLKISTLFSGGFVERKSSIKLSFWLFVEIKKEKKRKNENKKPKTTTNKHNQTATNSEVTRKCFIHLTM